MTMQPSQSREQSRRERPRQERPRSERSRFQPDRSDFAVPSEDVLKQIIIDEDGQGAELLVRSADEIGQGLARDLTTSQIRAIFGEVRRIEGLWKTDSAHSARASRDLILLRPKMAYRAKKEKGKGVQKLVDVLDPAIRWVGQDHDRFTRFVEFFEAILAYHKVHGGKD